MTLLLDASALLAAVIDGRDRDTIAGAIDEHTGTAYASALALTEAIAAIDRLSDEEAVRADLEDEVRRLWDHVHVVPVDQRCLDEAARLLRERPLRLADAIHLAAGARLPAPVRFATVDAAHLTAALAVGLDVIAP